MNKPERQYVQPAYVRAMLIILLQLFALTTFAQHIPKPEMGMGITIKSGKIFYGKTRLHITDPGSVAIEGVWRYDYPLQYNRPGLKQRYIDLAIEAGFMFCKAKEFDTLYADPVNNIFVYDRSYNSSYFPVGAGIYNRSKFSLGTGLFYWKALSRDTKDIWGAKFLSLGYNGNQFRFSLAGEWYQQLSNRRHTGTVLSFEFLWKLIRDDY